MDQLFIEIEIDSSSDGTEILTSVESFLALYVHRFLESPVKLNFVCGQMKKPHETIKIRSESLRANLTKGSIICKKATKNQAICDLRLPIYTQDGNTYVAGMCAVCRILVADYGSVKSRQLLGFKESCLLAPAECSLWTRFCEVDMVKAIHYLLEMQNTGQSISEVPEEIVRFEQHMSEPVRMHNIYKVAKKHDRCIPKEQLPIKHRFAEGMTFTIADLILYPCLRLLFTYCYCMLDKFPQTSSWFKEVDIYEPRCCRILNELQNHSLSLNDKFLLLKIPEFPCKSLYKNCSKRFKPIGQMYTNQKQVDAALAKLSQIKEKFSSDNTIIYNESCIDWNTIEPEHAKSSALPPIRLHRKRQQLENIVNAVISLVQPGDRIIDFCSGTGHLGLLLALKLPYCNIILLENKSTSLRLARARATSLQLKNCFFYQCNIDYFEGYFDLGTSLHACGTATDIVLQQCQRLGAKFVCCPCCYGSLQPMPHVAYPLSKCLRAVINEKEYLYIAHAADQAHEIGTQNCKPEILQQGQFCMDVVDTDRKLQAEEAGYHVILTRLKPENCTPKNRLLVGKIALT